MPPRMLLFAHALARAMGGGGVCRTPWPMSRPLWIGDPGLETGCQIAQRIRRRSAAYITQLGAQHASPCGKLRIFWYGVGLLLAEVVCGEGNEYVKLSWLPKSPQ